MSCELIFQHINMNVVFWIKVQSRGLEIKSTLRCQKLLRLDSQRSESRQLNFSLFLGTFHLPSRRLWQFNWLVGSFKKRQKPLDGKWNVIKNKEKEVQFPGFQSLTSLRLARMTESLHQYPLNVPSLWSVHSHWCSCLKVQCHVSVTSTSKYVLPSQTCK